MAQPTKLFHVTEPTTNAEGHGLFRAYLMAPELIDILFNEQGIRALKYSTNEDEYLISVSPLYDVNEVRIDLISHLNEKAQELKSKVDDLEDLINKALE